jgi:hypothetical protein
MRNWQSKALVVALSLGTAIGATAQGTSNTIPGGTSPATRSSGLANNPRHDECAGLTGTSLRDCLRTHPDSAAGTGSANTQSRGMQGSRDTMRSNPTGSKSGSTSDAGNAANGAASGTGASSGAGTSSGTGNSGSTGAGGNASAGGTAGAGAAGGAGAGAAGGGGGGH